MPGCVIIQCGQQFISYCYSRIHYHWIIIMVKSVKVLPKLKRKIYRCPLRDQNGNQHADKLSDNYGNVTSNANSEAIR